MYSKRGLFFFLLGCIATAFAHEHEQTQDPRVVAEWTRWLHLARGEASSVTPSSPLPDGVTELAFSNFFVASESGELEFSPMARALDGRRVRLTGYMVKQDEWTAGQFLLTRFPVATNEHEYGFCDDLPVNTVHVLLSDPKENPSLRAGPISVIGRLHLGPKTMADGRISAIRISIQPDTHTAAFSPSVPNLP